MEHNRSDIEIKANNILIVTISRMSEVESNDIPDSPIIRGHQTENIGL